MPRSRHRDLREAVEAINYYNDGVLFHKTVDMLALMLDFAKTREWYEAEAIAPKITKQFFSDKTFDFKTLDNLEACIFHGMLFNYFEHNAHYENGSESFKASTLYKNPISLLRNEFKNCAVTSKSTLGLNYKVVPRDELNLICPGDDSKSDVMRALDNKFIIQIDNDYLISPKYLLKLAEQKGILR